MKTTKINDTDISSMLIASLPSRPTAPAAFGGRGYGAVEMKAAFDKLPLYLVSKFNSLLDDLATEGEEGALASIPTGISEGHTLFKLLSDIRSGSFAGYLDVFGESLSKRITDILSELSRLSDHAASTPDHSIFVTGDQLDSSLAEYYTSEETVQRLNSLKHELESFVTQNVIDRPSTETVLDILKEYITSHALLIQLSSYVKGDELDERIGKACENFLTAEHLDGVFSELATLLDRLNNGGASDE